MKLTVLGGGGVRSAFLGKVRISHQTQKNAYVSD